MKYICVTDTHCGIKDGSPLYHDVNERLFAYIFDYAEHNKINQLIHLGDYFHNRKSIPIKSILVALRIADMCDRIFKDTYIITGNHDTIYKDSNDESLLSMFSEYKGITIVNQPFKLGNILMVPWLFPHEILENLVSADILLGHFEINGCVMNEAGTKAENRFLSQGDFNNFKLVLSGHYHTPGVYGNIQYLGSPFHTSFNDVAGKRGFYVLDDETCEVEFIEFDDYPKFVRIKDTDVWTEEIVYGNIVEFIFTQDYGINKNIEIVERVKSCSPLTLRVKYVNINEAMSQEDIAEEDIDIKDHLEILQEYYEYSEQPEHINLKVLKKMAEKIYKETVDGR